MSEIEVWLLAIGIMLFIYITIVWVVVFENQKRVAMLYDKATSLDARITNHSMALSELDRIIYGKDTVWSVNNIIKNPNMAVEEIQKRVELILEKLGVEVEEEARLVDKNG